MPTFPGQALDAQGQKALNEDLRALFNRHNKATDGTLILEAQYSQSISTKG